MKKVLVERIIDFEGNSEGMDFDRIEQKIATVEVEEEDGWTMDRLVEAAYNKANMNEREDEHRVTALGKSVSVDTRENDE